MKKIRLIISCLIVFVILFFGWLITTNMTSGESIDVNNMVKISNPTPKTTIQYIPLGIPYINSSFKTYMDYKSVTDKDSSQYKLIKSWGWIDAEGFMRCNREEDLEIEEHYYFIALGSYYGTKIGTKYRITTDSGKIFYGVLADCKSDIHTNSTNQYNSWNGNIVEFLVDTTLLNNDIKKIGSANVYMPLNGSITKIERIDFMEE